MVSGAFSRPEVRHMYPLLYEAAMTLRTIPKDTTLRTYLRLEYPGTAPAWLFARRPARVRHIRTPLLRALAWKLRAGRPTPAVPEPSDRISLG